MKPLTRDALARALGVHPHSITRWQRQGLPVAVTSRGGQPALYDLAAVRRWRQARDEARQAERGEHEAIRARRELAQALEVEQRIALRAARYLVREDADRLWSAYTKTLRRRLLRQPARWAPGVVKASKAGGPAAIEAELVDRVYELLTDLAAGPGRQEHA